MTANDDLDLRLRSWMATTSPTREPAGLVRDAMVRTASVRQRPAILVRTGLGHPRFALPALASRALIVGFVVLLLVAVAAAVIVGSQLTPPRLEDKLLVSESPASQAPRSAAPDRSAYALTGGLVTDRFGHTATRLRDGRVLVAGGNGPLGSSLNAAEVWDPATSRSTLTGPMVTARSRATATLLDDGRVLIAGGETWPSDEVGGEIIALASAELYDPATGSFTSTGQMHSTRGTVFGGGLQASATILADGRVFVAGASPLGSTADIYDPTSGTFTKTPPIPCGDVRTVTRLHDGRVLVTCVRGQSGAVDVPRSAEAALYDPSSDAFSATGDPTTMNTRAATLLSDGRVLLTGLSGGSTEVVDIYDPLTGTFARVDTGTKSSEVAVGLADGRVLLVGTLDRKISMEDRKSDAGAYVAELFDPVTNTLTSILRPLGTHFLETATLLADGRVLIVGSGTGALNHPALAPPEVFDPSALP